MPERIKKAVAAALSELGKEDISFAVERPADMVHGDYAVNAAMVVAKTLGKNPREIAEQIAGGLKKDLGDSVAKIEIAGPGFINITLSQSAINESLENANGNTWGTNTTRKGRRVMIEYANPNPFKEMHIGHMMGAIVGEALSRLIESEGAVLSRDTFGGDVGPHVAKALWSLKRDGVTDIDSVSEIGNAYIHGSRAYEESPEAKAEIDALNKEIYAVVAQVSNAVLSGDRRELFSLWQKGREISMEEFRRLYSVLGTKFDYEFFDSDATTPGIDLVMDGLLKGIFEKSEGAIIYRGEEKGVHTMVFITSHGTPTYEAKDIGLAFLKEERWPSDEIVIVTANEQSGRFKTVLAALAELAPNLAAKTRHVPHGFMRLTSGKMSSREGNIITASALISDVTKAAGEKNSDPLIAEQVAIAAIKYMILRQSPGQDIIFDPEKSLSLEGDSGPYLQYALVRAKSVLAQSATTSEKDSKGPEEPYAIERLMLHFPETVARAARELAPQLLAQFLTELAGEWNSFYAQERIIGGEFEAYKLRVAEAFVHTMQNGLMLLGIPAPEKM
ncbi:MAG: arginine--tRNA ligase [Minisyncoccia bacterium]